MAYISISLFFYTGREPIHSQDMLINECLESGRERNNSKPNISRFYFYIINHLSK